MTKSLTILLVSAGLAATQSSAALARVVCKDGVVAYPGSTSSKNRATAEASAIRAWQAIRDTRPAVTARRPDPREIKCLRDGSGEWRCHIRGGKCVAA